jgi:hypothetical protein
MKEKKKKTINRSFGSFVSYMQLQCEQITASICSNFVMLSIPGEKGSWLSTTVVYNFQ